MRGACTRQKEKKSAVQCADRNGAVENGAAKKWCGWCVKEMCERGVRKRITILQACCHAVVVLKLNQSNPNCPEKERCAKRGVFFPLHPIFFIHTIRRDIGGRAPQVGPMEGECKKSHVCRGGREERRERQRGILPHIEGEGRCDEWRERERMVGREGMLVTGRR